MVSRRLLVFLNLIADYFVDRQVNFLHLQFIHAYYLVLCLHRGLTPRDVLESLLQARNHLIVIALALILVIGCRATRLLVGPYVSSLGFLDLLELVVQKVCVQVILQRVSYRGLLRDQVVARAVVLPDGRRVSLGPRYPGQHRNVFTLFRAPRDLPYIKL